MPGRLSVEVAIDRGYVLVGGMRIALTAGESDVIRTSGGARLRALTFARRGELVTEAIGADDPVAALAESIERDSTIDAAGLEKQVLVALSCALAGGGEEHLTFGEAARLACERQCWSWDRVLEAPAWYVDRVAADRPEAPGEWSTFLFPSLESVDLSTVTRAMTMNLLRRAVESATAPESARMKQAPSRARIGQVRTPLRAAKAARAGSDFQSTTRSRSAATRAAGESHALGRDRTKGSRRVLAAATFASERTAKPSPAASPLDIATEAAPNEPAFAQPLTSRPAPALARASIQASPTTGNLPGGALETSTIRSAASRTQIAAVETPPVRWADPSPAPCVLTPSNVVGPTASPLDWLDHMARALSAECDLRGLDR